MMTEDELRDLAAAGVELGAHTVTHPDLSTLDKAACLQEMAESRREIEEHHRRARCAPSPTRSAATATPPWRPPRRPGFLAAVTCEGRGGWAPYEMKRAMLTGKDGWPTFLLKLGDAYQPLFDSAPGRFARVASRAARRRVRELRAGRD